MPSLVALLVEVPLDLLDLLEQLAHLVEPALEPLVLHHPPPMLLDARILVALRGTRMVMVFEFPRPPSFFSRE